jgi:diguanylate cyclase (GGDEF)-like protein/PAS domain S-box-containing protein
MKKYLLHSDKKIEKQKVYFCSKDSLIQECTIFQYNPEAMLFVDKNRRVLAINPRFSQLFDYQLEDVQGKKIDAFILFANNKQKSYADFWKKLGQQFYISEAILTKKDHSVVEIEISASHIYSSKQNHQGILLAFKDITQRNENEKLNKVLYNISKAANSNISLQELYDTIYQELNNIIDAKNFHIALWDKEKDKVIFTYFVDEKDKLDERENKRGVSGTLANYNIKYGKSLLANYDQILKFAEAGQVNIANIGTLTEKTSWLGVPLKSGNQIIGSMAAVNYDKQDIYSEKDINLMEFVSEQVATAIERKRSEESLRQNEEKFVSLFRSNPPATLYQDEEGTILDINLRFTELFGYKREDVIGENIDQINFYPPEKTKEGKKLTRSASRSTLIKYETYRRSKDGRDIPVQISTSQVKIKDQVRGIIALYEDITEQKQNEKLKQVLYNISQAANSKITLVQLYSIIHMELKKVINADNFYIALLDESTNELCFVYYNDEKETDFCSKNISQRITLTDYLIVHQQSLLLNYNQIQELVLGGKVQDPGAVTEEICWLSVPLETEGKVIGAMTVQNYYNPTSYSEKDIKLMEIVADQVATAIVIKQSEEKITYISFHDTLTGLYNRAYFKEELKRMNHPRFFPLSVVMIDVNGLKAVNDAFGHHQGDELLKNLAKILQSNSREVDVLARLGGDEFAIILPTTSISDVEAFSQRINNSCKQNYFQPAYLNPNISIGFATQEGALVNCEEIIKEADHKMYQNKLFNAKSREKYLLNAFLTILAERDVHTESHAQRLANISSIMGQKIGLNHYELNRLHLLALLHDIGKIGIPEDILFKADPLTNKEWEKLKNHCQIGYRIAKNIPDFSSIAKEILYHHERWDGTGYPVGLKEKEIPLLSRIIAIVDAYDTMQSSRNYKKTLNQKEALEVVRKNAGSQFDPDLVTIFLEVLR